MKIYSCRRRGVSMLESLIYLSLSVVLITLTAQWFHVVFQVASRNNVRQRQHISLKRLASDFRHDIISATDVALTSPEILTLVNAAGEEVVYEISDKKVGKLVGDVNQPTRQEAYPDLEDLRLEFVSGESASSKKWFALNVFRPVRQKRLEKTDLQPRAEESGFEKRLLQVRCGPYPFALEAVQ